MEILVTGELPSSKRYKRSAPIAIRDAQSKQFQAPKTLQHHTGIGRGLRLKVLRLQFQGDFPHPRDVSPYDTMDFCRT